MGTSKDLKAITVYLPHAEVDALHAEAKEAGRSGASAQIRWLLTQLRSRPSPETADGPPKRPV